MTKVTSSLIFTFFILMCFSLSAQHHSVEWVKTMGGPNNDIAFDMTIDSQGNILTTGTFVGNSDFDPGAGVENLYSGPPSATWQTWNSDAFIQKLDSNGNLLWVKRIGNNFDSTAVLCRPLSIKTDDSDNIYISGVYYGLVDFDPGNSQFLSSATMGSIDSYLVKLNSEGEFVWVKFISELPLSNADIHSIDVDSFGDIIVTGNFTGTCDFDPNGGVYYLTSPDIDDAFILKLNNNGEFIWAKQLNANNVIYSQEVKVDANRNIYTVGLFNGGFDADPGIGEFLLNNTIGRSNSYVHKLNPNGEFVWVKAMYDNNISDIGVHFIIGESIDIDGLGNVYITGACTDSIDFDPGIDTLYIPNHGNHDIYVQKLDVNGDLVWAKGIGGMSFDNATKISCGVNNEVFITGSYNGMGDFDPGVGTMNLTSIGVDVVVLMLTSEGELNWVNTIGGTNSEGLSVTLDNSNNVYATGRFIDIGTVLESGTPQFNIASSGMSDAFIAKYKYCMTSGIDHIITCDPYTWIDGNVYTSTNNSASYTLTNAAGCDSIVYLNLSFDGSMNTSIEVNGHTVTANNSTGSYIWLDCDQNYSPILGETNQSFTANAFGSYAVEISENGCVDTSACQILIPLGIIDHNFSDNLKVFPNPNSGEFYVEFGQPQDKIDLKVYSLLGKEVINKEFCNTTSIPVELTGQSGLYIIKIVNSNSNEAIIRVVKE